MAVKIHDFIYCPVSSAVVCFSRPRKHRACNFRHAANPAPETEEEEELEQWRPHRRTPTPPQPPLRSSIVAFLSSSVRRAKSQSGDGGGEADGDPMRDRRIAVARAV